MNLKTSEVNEAHMCNWLERTRCSPFFPSLRCWFLRWKTTTYTAVFTVSLYRYPPSLSLCLSFSFVGQCFADSAACGPVVYRTTHMLFSRQASVSRGVYCLQLNALGKKTSLKADHTSMYFLCSDLAAAFKPGRTKHFHQQTPDKGVHRHLASCFSRSATPQSRGPNLTFHTVSNPRLQEHNIRTRCVRSGTDWTTTSKAPTSQHQSEPWGRYRGYLTKLQRRDARFGLSSLKQKGGNT